MSEHFGRYARLTQALAVAGYAVYANDHRGHGASASAHGLGSFGPGGFQALIDDMAALTVFAKRETPGAPLALLGHSTGSFAAQLYLLEHYRELAALVLSGTAALDRLLESLLAGGGPVTLELLNAGFEPGSGARKNARLKWVRDDLPIYVISGERDPVLGPEQVFTRALIDGWAAGGLWNVEHHVYPGGRHEMFNETCREQVRDELIAWLDRVLR